MENTVRKPLYQIGTTFVKRNGVLAITEINMDKRMYKLEIISEGENKGKNGWVNYDKVHDAEPSFIMPGDYEVVEENGVMKTKTEKAPETKSQKFARLAAENKERGPALDRKLGLLKD